MRDKNEKVKIPDFAGMKEINFPAEYGSGSSFVAGGKEDDRLKIRYFVDSERRFYARVFFGKNAQGPPAHVHGGAMAAVLDETLGLAAWVAGFSIVSANLNVTYLNMLPIGKEVIISTNIDSVDNNKVLVSGKLFDFDGIVYTSATVLTIVKPIELLGSQGFFEYIEAQLS